MRTAAAVFGALLVGLAASCAGSSSRIVCAPGTAQLYYTRDTTVLGSFVDTVRVGPDSIRVRRYDSLMVVQTLDSMRCTPSPGVRLTIPESVPDTAAGDSVR